MGRVDLLQKCIFSLLNQSEKPGEILILFNGEPSKLKLVRRFVNTCVNTSSIVISIVFQRKRGAAHARNLGISRSKGKYLAFIDDDCTASHHWIKELHAYFQKYGENIVIKGQNKNGNPHNIYSCLEYYTDESFFKAGQFKIEDKQIQSIWLDTKNCAMTKKEIVKRKLLFFNFNIFEDLDFSCQLRKKKIAILYCPNAVVWHRGRTHIVSHFVREIKKGIDMFLLIRKWKHEDITLYPLVNNQLKEEIENKNNQISLSLLKKTLKDKNIIYKVYFLTCLSINRSFNRVGFAMKGTM